MNVMNTCLKFKKYVILLLAIGAFIGCSKDDDDPQPSSSSNNNPTTKEHFTYKLNGEMTNATDSAFLFIYNNSASISTTEGGGFPKHDISLSFTDTLSEGTYKLGDGNFTAFINKKFDENCSNNY